MKTLLVDDHALFREGLALLIAHGFPQLHLLQAGSIAEALSRLAAEPRMELVLLDLGLPDSEGLGGLRRLREQAPGVMVVVLSADESPETVLAAVEAGAAGFIPKTAHAGVMQTALRVVLAGGVYLPAAMLAQAPAPRRPATVPAAPTHAPEGEDDASLGLSPRQLDVLRLVIAGQPNKLICRGLALSESTVKTHLAAIFRKLDVSSRTQAVVAAARLGLRLGNRPAVD